MDQFLDCLINFDKENIAEANQKAVQPYLENKEFDPDFIRSKSAAAAGTYSRINAHTCINAHLFLFDDPMVHVYVYVLYIQMACLCKHPLPFFGPSVSSTHGHLREFELQLSLYSKLLAVCLFVFYNTSTGVLMSS